MNYLSRIHREEVQCLSFLFITVPDTTCPFKGYFLTDLPTHSSLLVLDWQDYDFILKGLARLLTNPLTQTYLPNSTKKIQFHQELLVLFWKLCDFNKVGGGKSGEQHSLRNNLEREVKSSENQSHVSVLFGLSRMCLDSQKFLFFVLKSSDVLDVLVPILFYLNDARADQCESDETHRQSELFISQKHKLLTHKWNKILEINKNVIIQIIKN